MVRYFTRNLGLVTVRTSAESRVHFARSYPNMSLCPSRRVLCRRLHHVTFKLQYNKQPAHSLNTGPYRCTPQCSYNSWSTNIPGIHKTWNPLYLITIASFASSKTVMHYLVYQANTITCRFRGNLYRNRECEIMTYPWNKNRSFFVHISLLHVWWI